ncbi:MAG: histidinol-phosphate transaminase [bacterium]|nr:histidinol-phosphate transaminase [bacterium]
MLPKVRKPVIGMEPYYPGKPVEEVKREFGLTDVIKLASNENPLGPSPLAKQAIMNTLDEANLYPDGSGFYLRQKLAQKFQVSLDEIILGSGSDEIISMLAQTFIEPGDEAVTSETSFVRYQQAVELMDGTMRYAPMQKYTYDLRALAKLITPKTKLVFIANPNNPTGTMVDKTAVAEFMHAVPPEVLVVFDEAYYEYVLNPEYPQTMEYFRDGKNVIILRTFSKIYGLAGVRVGYGFANPELLNLLNKVRPPFNVNRIAQIAAVASLDDTEHVAKSRETNRQGKEYLEQELTKLGMSYVPTEANFMLIECPIDAKIVYDNLLRQGVIVRPLGGKQLANLIRVTIGTMPQNERFITALKTAVSN